MLAIAIPNFVKARETAQMNACISNLRMIDGAKQQWVLEQRKQPTDVPTEGDIAPYLKNGQMPKCPAGGDYKVNAAGDVPTCSISKHVMP